MNICTVAESLKTFCIYGIVKQQVEARDLNLYIKDELVDKIKYMYKLFYNCQCGNKIDNLDNKDNQVLQNDLDIIMMLYRTYEDYYKLYCDWMNYFYIDLHWYKENFECIKTDNTKLTF